VGTAGAAVPLRRREPMRRIGWLIAAGNVNAYTRYVHSVVFCIPPHSPTLVKAPPAWLESFPGTVKAIERNPSATQRQ
jgi:hypothetical protein